MNILNLEGQYFVPYFRQAGHQVLTVGHGRVHDLTLSQPLSLSELWDFLQGRGFMPDLVLWNDICRPPAVIGFERLPAVTIGAAAGEVCGHPAIPPESGALAFPPGVSEAPSPASPPRGLCPHLCPESTSAQSERGGST